MIIRLKQMMTNHKHRHKQQQSMLRNNSFSSWPRLIIFILATILIQCNFHQVPKLALAFNVDTQYPIVHQGPPNSYFGFAVAQHREKDFSWLLIGAPKAQLEKNSASKTHSGAVYKCLPTRPSCQQVQFDPTGPRMIQENGSEKPTEDKSYQWFGASLHSANENGSFVACAPRYVHFSENYRRREPVGACWISHSPSGRFQEISPCRLEGEWSPARVGSCQAGFSSAISKDGSRLYMGAPGAHIWQGQVFAYNLNSNTSQTTSPVNPHSEDDSLLGYTIALGRFTAQSASSQSGSHDQDLAIGIPRADDLAGKVMLVDNQMRTIANLTGEQVGSRFGEALAIGDINGDGLDDLIVGAPYFHNYTSRSPRNYDRGRVYVYLQNPRHEFRLVQRIDGLQDGARLGTSIAIAGDLNKDGYLDVAVGAPYAGSAEKRAGSVYILLGGRKDTGLASEPDQIISAESLMTKEKLTGFGYSISGGFDLDNNQYPDLLVGAYSSDKAVVLRTRPIVNVNFTLNFQPKYFNLEDKSCQIALSNGTQTGVPCMTVQYCAKYNNINIDKLNLNFTERLDTENKGTPRLFFLNQPVTKSEDQFRTTLTRDVQQCRSFKVYITPQIRDKLTPIKVEVDYNLIEGPDVYDPNSSLMKLRPIINNNKLGSGNNNKISEIVSIQKNCGQDNICVPDLRLDISSNLQTYTLGSNDKLVYDFTVRNNGEDAFESMLYLTIPANLDYIEMNKSSSRAEYPICYGPKLIEESPDENNNTLDNNKILECDLGNPLAHDGLVKFSVTMEPVKGDFSVPEFVISAQVNSTNPEADDRRLEDNRSSLKIPIRVETNLQLSGYSDPPHVNYNSSRDFTKEPEPKIETDLGREIYHVYQISNRGPSPISNLAVNILWPTKDTENNYLLYLVDEPELSPPGKVVCKPSPYKTINPLILKYQKGNDPGADRSKGTNQIESKNNQHVEKSQSINRQKRQIYLTSSSSASTGELEQQSTTMDNNGTDTNKNTQQPTVSTVDKSILEEHSFPGCGQTRECDRFECNVIHLKPNDYVTIKIRSRLYELTLSELNIPRLIISSRLTAQVKSLPYNVSTKSLPYFSHQVETQIDRLQGTDSLKDLLPWWLILLAILLGIILFSLLALFLKYLGFFARKRPPKAGTTEREPLTATNWNDYHYTPNNPGAL